MSYYACYGCYRTDRAEGERDEAQRKLGNALKQVEELKRTLEITRGACSQSTLNLVDLRLHAAGLKGTSC